MKKATIYILLFLYTVVQLKPLTAVLQDVFAHTFFNLQHMATVHYENGRYHLHKELKTIHEQDNSSRAGQKQASVKSLKQLSPQNFTELHFNLSQAACQAALPLCLVKDLLAGFIRITSPPPQLKC